MELRPPSGVLLGSLLPPLEDLLPLPKLTTVPARLTTPVMLLEQDYGARYDDAVATLIGKVQAEDQRMRRLLPAAPRGMRWEVELQMQEPDYNFTMHRADMIVRLVYRLKEN